MDDFEKHLSEKTKNPEDRKELKAAGILHEYVKGRKPDLAMEENAWRETAVEKYQMKKQEELLNTYAEERECDYKDRHYRVRDNGSVFRLPKEPGKPHRGDNEWTFGTFNKRNGYLFIGSHQVHRIVATAFHGTPPSETDIVDHIDTDRQNNRAENLRWTTKLENALNPATRKKLEMMTGLPIDKILEDISILRQYNLDREFQWMGAVSKEEGQRTLENMTAWAKIPYKIPDKPYVPSSNIIKPPSPRLMNPYKPTSYDFTATEKDETADSNETEDSLPPGCIRSLTPKALERGWKAPYEFPYCPQDGGNLESYFDAIELGKEVAIGRGYSFLATGKAMNKDGSAICMKTFTADGVKPYGVMTITLEDGWFVHEGKGYFQEDGQEKYFTIAKGEEWTGGEVYDDFC